MSIKYWSEDIVLIRLPPEPRMFDELDAATKTIGERRNCDVVIDLAGVHIMTAPGTARLLALHNLLTQCKRNLVFCNVSGTVKGILTSNGFDHVLQFADGSSTALANVQLLRNKD